MKFMYCSIRCLLEKQSQNTRKHARLIKVKSRELWPSSYYKSGFNISFLFNISIDMNQHHIRASPRALVSWVSQLKKRKERQKTHIQQKLYLPRLLFSFSIQRVPLDIFVQCSALTIPFWILEKPLDFISFSLAISFYIIAISEF